MLRTKKSCESRMREICMSGLTRGGAVAVIPQPPSYSTGHSPLPTFRSPSATAGRFPLWFFDILNPAVAGRTAPRRALRPAPTRRPMSRREGAGRRRFRMQRRSHQFTLIALIALIRQCPSFPSGLISFTRIDPDSTPSHFTGPSNPSHPSFAHPPPNPLFCVPCHSTGSGP